MMVYVVMGDDIPQRVFDTLRGAEDFAFARTQENLTQRPAVFWQVYELEVQWERTHVIET